jgi:hypothetical protein
MKNIIDRIWVGKQREVQKALNDGFTVASMTKEGPEGHRAIVGYTTLGATPGKEYYYAKRGKHFAANLIDIDDPAFIPEEVINPALEFIKEHYYIGDKILINCEEAHSRSPVTCLLFLRAINEMPYPFVRAEKIFRTLYPEYDPGVGMRSYARTHWRGLENASI